MTTFCFTSHIFVKKCLQTWFHCNINTHINHNTKRFCCSSSMTLESLSSKVFLWFSLRMREKQQSECIVFSSHTYLLSAISFGNRKNSKLGKYKTYLYHHKNTHFRPFLHMCKSEDQIYHFQLRRTHKDRCNSNLDAKLTCCKKYFSHFWASPDWIYDLKTTHS